MAGLNAPGASLGMYVMGVPEMVVMVRYLGAPVTMARCPQSPDHSYSLLMLHATSHASFCRVM